MTKIKIQKWNGPDAIICARYLSQKPYSIFLDSNRPSHPLNQWSFICFDPVEIIKTKNGIIEHDGKNIGQADFFDFLQKRLDSYDFGTQNTSIPFQGGIAGYFGYDLGRQLEDITTDTIDNLGLPDAIVGIYTNVLAFDHSRDEAWYIGNNAPDIPNTTNTPYAPPQITWQSDKTDDEYCADVQKVIDYIYAGEIYQANLSRRFEANTPKDFDTFRHYEHLREINPAPFSSYLNFKDLKILSCSPEQFLSLAGEKVLTSPIKGTLPSNKDPQILLDSQKDLAENTMIVDLLRNDLSKVCDFHSVKVPALCQLETFEGLHHLVSKVTGTIKAGNKALDLLKACFPGGSITGAPKIRAMEIIEELEKTYRGPYCGSIGYIGFDGSMDSNITIRTLIHSEDKLYLQLGSGIVSDSTPQKELEETNQKGAKIFDSFIAKKNEDVA